jgi:L,D-transpeptidase catalytic domain
MVSRLGAVSRNPRGVERSSDLVLGFRSGLNQPRRKPLVKPPIGINAPFRGWQASGPDEALDLSWGQPDRSGAQRNTPGGRRMTIHGTSSPSDRSNAVSHGCVRVYNEDLKSLLDVPLGTPVEITTQSSALFPPRVRKVEGNAGNDGG